MFEITCIYITIIYNLYKFLNKFVINGIPARNKSGINIHFNYSFLFNFIFNLSFDFKFVFISVSEVRKRRVTVIQECMYRINIKKTIIITIIVPAKMIFCCIVGQFLCKEAEFRRWAEPIINFFETGVEPYIIKTMSVNHKFMIVFNFMIKYKCFIL